MERDLELEMAFPNLLPGEYNLKSPVDPTYNCLAFAADIDTKRLWPGKEYYPLYDWPRHLTNEDTIECVCEYFAAIGYKVCLRPSWWAYLFKILTLRDPSIFALERGFEKIAIYGIAKEPLHLSKQIPDGRWKSKLGYGRDIEHNTLKALECQDYGKPVVIMKKRISNANNPTS